MPVLPAPIVASGVSGIVFCWLNKDFGAELGKGTGYSQMCLIPVWGWDLVLSVVGAVNVEISSHHRYDPSPWSLGCKHQTLLGSGIRVPVALGDLRQDILAGFVPL